MDIRMVKMRMQFLELEQARELNPDRKLELEHRRMECADWLKIQNEDPRFGEDVKINGEWVPRLPTFKNKEEMQKVLDDPEGREGQDPDIIRAARAYRASVDAQEQADFLNGKAA
jgi:hypothetical protein